jgi:tagaturonate epimerase
MQKSMEQTYEASRVELDGTIYELTLPDAEGRKYLLVQGDANGFEGTPEADFLKCPLTPANAAQLRARLPWLVARPLGLAISAGFGDRLGIATPGHISAVKDTGIAPIFAQQSVRENARTHRTPQIVMDDAMWGVFQSGWNSDWGGDADHLKTLEDITPFVAAGYTFFTIDPGEFVDDAAQSDDLATLRQKVDALDWATLESSPAALREQLLKSFTVGHLTLEFDEATLLQAAAKYGGAVSHTVKMARRLVESLPAFDLEMSVDETNTVTSFAEHFYIMSELRRLNIPVNSLAPRFVGQFEKGVDYIGDLGELEDNLAGHAAIQSYFGRSYKISLHSGSDKFAVYPIAMRVTGGFVHLKTAGTSYLEALRVMSEQEPEFFREIVDFARERYDTDRKTYHVSALLDRLPDIQPMSDAELPTLLDQFDARQILHVTFGSTLDRFGERLHALLRKHELAYEEGVRRHFEKHLAPFVAAG